VLVSWNFKHIVNLERIRGYNGINYQLGYNMIEIRTPKEIMIYGKKNNKNDKKFDAIKVMREIRDRISLEIMNMTYDEERAYLDKLISEGKSKINKVLHPYTVRSL